MEQSVTPQSLAGLTPEQKRELLARLLKQKQSQPASSSVAAAEPPSAPPVLSITQERMWQLDQVQPRNPIYNFQSAIELEGPLDVGALKRALRGVVERHEALRMVYGADRGQPKLSLLPALDAALDIRDWTGVAEIEQWQRFHDEARSAAQAGFALAEPPLFRLSLFCMAPRRHVLMLTMHHIVSDLLSLELFFSDLGALYGAALGNGKGLPALPTRYQDFARRQQAEYAKLADGPAARFWRELLATPQPIEWHADYPRPERASGAAATVHFEIGAEQLAAVERLAREESLTPFMVLLAAFFVLQYAATGQDDQIVGSPTAGRGGSDLDGLIGMFSYPLPMRVSLAGEPSFRDILQRVRKVALGVTEHADVPFARIVELAQQGGALRAPLIRSMFSYVSRVKDLAFPGLALRRVPTDRGMSDFDLFLTLFRDSGRWLGFFEYSTDLFSATTARKWADAYGALLTAVTTDPQRSLGELARQVPVRRAAQIAVAATFTADTLEDVTRLWSRELRTPLRVLLSPYNQVFQELLNPGSTLYAEGNTLNVLLVRPEDWVRYTEGESARRTEMARATDDFIEAVRGAASGMRCPLRVYVCPASPESAEQDAIAEAERTILARLADVKGITAVRADEALSRYALSSAHDAQSNRIGHIPFTRDWFAAMGTELTRRATSLARAPFKVIALDCDNTLWRGVCGEDGATGVKVDTAYRALQQFMMAQANEGMLLCLVSKNEAGDVFEVLEQHPDMVLRRDRIVGHRINWLPKSENLRSLAQELQLGLDSFIFIDDNPVECAEVRAACPEVLTLCLPTDAAAIPDFLEHVWAFDRGAVSSEDRKRAQSYMQNRQREELRQKQTSFAEFIEKLALVVDIDVGDDGSLPRLAQLSQRTNQFNNAGVRYDEATLRRACGDGLHMLAVRVKDRFGDYGLVGAMFYRAQAEVLHVESFLLSCRVLGRGVEHRMLSTLGRRAQELGLARVEIAYQDLPRNQPIRRFLDSLDGSFEQNAGGTCYALTAGQASETRFDPERLSTIDTVTGETDAAATPPTISEIDIECRHALTRIAEELRDVSAILARMSGSVRRVRAGGAAAAAPPQSESERVIAEVWQQVLHFDALGRDDNFFDVGGNSLMLVQVNGQLIERFGRDIPITTLFQFPTIASLAAHLDNAGADTAESLQKSQDRGQQARDQMQKRMQQLSRLRRPAGAANAANTKAAVPAATQS
jgi:FkbH-like protein